MSASANTIDIAFHRRELEQAWQRSDQLFELLTPQAWSQRPIALRHPFVFYLGHLPAFAWNQIGGGLLEQGRFHPVFDELFERGIDPDDAGDLTPTTIAWPTVAEIIAYRNGVRQAVLDSFAAVQSRAADDVLAAGGRIYRLVVEHELMHHETLMYMFEQLDPAYKRRPKDLLPLPKGSTASSTPVAIPGGPTTIGADFEAQPFGWDNEFPALHSEVPAFRIDSLPVTVNEFRDFVEAGGYQQPQWWDAGDWVWRQKTGLDCPLNWQSTNGSWLYRTSFETVAIETVGQWPANVSLAEAEAYCRWRGKRLPTEAEMHRAAYAAPDGTQRLYPWGDQAPQKQHGNFGWQYFSPVPVGSHPAGASAWGVEELVGNGWEWTTTLFRGLPGFKPYARTYPGYSQDFFDDLHCVIFGGAWPTDSVFLRRSYRNWFQRRYPYVFAAFRCVST